MEKCPNELIGLFLEEPSLKKKDLANFARVSRRFQKIADRVLYRTLGIDIDPIPYPGNDMVPPVPEPKLARFRRMVQAFHTKKEHVRALAYSHTSAKYLTLGPNERLFKNYLSRFNRIRRFAMYTFGDGPQYFPWVEILKGISGILVSNPNLEELVIVHKPNTEELSQDLDMGSIQKILRQGTVVKLKVLTLQFILAGWAHEIREDTWGLTDNVMTVLEGCTNNIMQFLLDYVVPAEGTLKKPPKGTRRRLWSLPGLRYLAINFIGRTVAPLSDIFDTASLSNVYGFHFLSPICQDFEEMTKNLSLLVRLKEIHIHILNVNNWVPPFLLGGEEMPVYGEEDCRKATELLIVSFKALGLVSFFAELPGRDGVLLMTYLVQRVPRQVFDNFELPAYAVATQVWSQVEEIGCLGIGHHMP
ncbi:hypothetical protein TWF506_011102 [Arthrobotrys conoides]|uniref:F-box domain-containing protein n=1 Tax=Arthrobotrys conoides TaxID=74498 RepID=A0AAN8NA16_9PEZI